MTIQEPTPTRSLEEKKAQYAAWRDRLKTKHRAPEVTDLADERPSRWSPEALRSDDWSASPPRSPGFRAAAQGSAPR